MDVGGALSLPLWGKVAPQGRMRGRCAIAARRRTAVGKFPLISQRAGPLTASPKGEAIQTTVAKLPLIRPCGATFSLRAKSRLRRLRSDTRLRAQPLGGRL